MDRRDLLRAVAASIVGGTLPAYVPCEHAAREDSPGPLWDTTGGNPLDDFQRAVALIEEQSRQPYRPPVLYLYPSHRDYILKHWNLDVADASVRAELSQVEALVLLGAQLAYVP